MGPCLLPYFDFSMEYFMEDKTHHICPKIHYKSIKYVFPKTNVDTSYGNIVNILNNIKNEYQLSQKTAALNGGHIDYYNGYIKYKTKYLKLKKLLDTK
jgi:hypothetical protein